MAKREHLCWSCLKCYGGCSWTEMTNRGIRFEPIPGWKAKKTKIGYHITACPEYEADESALRWERSGRYENVQTRAGSVPIRASNIKTGEVVRYGSVSEAVKRNGFRYDRVWECLNGYAKSHHGFLIEEDKV